MINAVIYARYSSHNQTEQSIEGQLADAHAYAQKNGYNVIAEYIDRALTGKVDARPDFQRMIKDAQKRQFTVVLVWKFDRFSRNRFDSAFYKTKLKKYGVRVISVMENIPDSPEGIILQGMLQSMAEYYSANLAENIRRGQAESVKKGWFLGGSIPYGYRTDNHHLTADEREAPIVRQIFTRYANGEKIISIVADLNQRGYRTHRGGKFTIQSINTIITNSAYAGRYTYAGTEAPGVADAIIDEALYEKASARRQANRRAPAASRSEVSFPLYGKLFCGHCGEKMIGDSGTSRSGEKHYYYSCSGRKHKRNGCKKKSEKKDYIQWYVCEQTVQYILDPDRMHYIAKAVVDVYNAQIDNTQIKALQSALKGVNDQLDKLIVRLATVPQKLVSRVTERMQTLQTQRIDLQTDIAKLRSQQKIPLTEKEVMAWMSLFAKGDLMDEQFRLKVIETFVNSVYLYDDKLIIFFNVKQGQETIGFEPIPEADELVEGSTLMHYAPPIQSKVEHSYLVVVRGFIGVYLLR